MNKSTFKSVARFAKTFLSKHSPEILTGIGITGLISAGVLAVKVTPKALMSIEEEKDELEKDKLTPIETIKAAGKHYIPAIVTSGVSVICIVGASSVRLKRNAALATAYSISETALKEYHDKVVKVIGSDKEQEVRDAIAKDKVEKHPVSEVILTEVGNTLCYDELSGRYFKSDVDKIKKAVNEINRNLLEDMYISLNDFYYEIGLPENALGNELGWHINDGFIDLGFSSQLTSDSTPCLVLDFRTPPIYNYENR